MPDTSQMQGPPRAAPSKTAPEVRQALNGIRRKRIIARDEGRPTNILLCDFKPVAKTVGNCLEASWTACSVTSGPIAVAGVGVVILMIIEGCYRAALCSTAKFYVVAGKSRGSAGRLHAPEIIFLLGKVLRKQELSSQANHAGSPRERQRETACAGVLRHPQRPRLRVPPRPVRGECDGVRHQLRGPVPANDDRERS